MVVISARYVALVRFLKLALVFVLVTACLADNLTYMRVDRSVIEKRLQPVPATDNERVDAIRAQFRAAGCAPEMIQEQAVPNEGLPNLICMVPGPDPGAIVIATRLDSNAQGEEAVVDWGGPILLPLLAESLNSAPHHQTMIFAAFAGHDHGFAGANYYLNHLNNEQRAQIRAMIQIDKIGSAPAAYAFPGPDTAQMATVGKRPVAMETAHEPTTLSKVLPIAARSLKLADVPTQINDIPATEARAFEQANIPAIVIHSPSYTLISPPGRMEPARLPDGGRSQGLHRHLQPDVRVRSLPGQGLFPCAVQGRGGTSRKGRHGTREQQLGRAASWNHCGHGDQSASAGSAVAPSGLRPNP